MEINVERCMEAKEQTPIDKVWDACVSILRKDSKPLPLWAVAKSTQWNEDDLMAAMISYCGPNSTVIEFNFGPRHTAITGLMARDGSYAVGTCAKT